VGTSNGGAQRGIGPSAYTRIAEIMSGRANFQQGFATTCKDSRHKGKLRPREDFGLAHEFVVAMTEG